MGNVAQNPGFMVSALFIRLPKVKFKAEHTLVQPNLGVLCFCALKEAKMGMKHIDN